MTEKFNQIKLALAILKALSERPYVPNELCDCIHALLEKHEQSTGDVPRKVGRMIGKLRDCGFEIHSAPNRPYELVASSFPIILTTTQREALTLAAYLLDDMGFSSQGSQILEILRFNAKERISKMKSNFSPPVDYSEKALAAIVQVLHDRFQRRRRYTICYRSSRGKQNTYDLDRSDLRLHNGVLYLFAFVPDFSARHHAVEKNQIFRVDRIQRVGPSSEIPWGILSFPTLELTYRMSGPLGSYQPRRENEKILNQHRSTPPQWVDIVATEESLFWFKQRLFQYRSNVKLLTPSWVVENVAHEMFKAAQRYWPNVNKGNPITT